MSQMNFERLKVGLRTTLSPEVVASMELTTSEDFFLDRMVAKLEAQVLATTLVDDRQTYTAQVPATWVQHWKHRHGGRWYARWWVSRHPARMSPLTVEARFRQKAVFPRARVMPPADRFGMPVTVEFLDLSTAGDWALEPGPATPAPRYLPWAEIHYEALNKAMLQPMFRMGDEAVAQAALEAVRAALSERGVNPDELMQR